MSFAPALTAKFLDVFGPSSATDGSGKVRVVRAPGRVNLIGEHTDYNDGYVFPMAIEPEIRFAFRARKDSKIKAASTLRTGSFVEFDLSSELTPNPEGKHWSNYLMGPAHFLKAAGVPLAMAGMDILIDNTLPAGSGLSSSAAMEVAMVRSLLLLAGVEMDYAKVARICQQAEHAFPKAPVGIMDMTASAGGKAGHAMLLDCRSLDVKYVPVPPADVRVVILNTKVEHSLAGAGGEYAKRRAQCEAAAKVIGVKALRDAKLADLEKAKDQLDPVVYKRAKHVVTEIARCLDAAEALSTGNYAKMGGLMLASHVSLRDDYEVSCKELDFMVDEALKVPGVYGARMTGGGFGGSAVALCTPTAVEAVKSKVGAAYQAKFNITPDILATAATEGAGEVK